MWGHEKEKWCNALLFFFSKKTLLGRGLIWERTPPVLGAFVMQDSVSLLLLDRWTCSRRTWRCDRPRGRLSPSATAIWLHAAHNRELQNTDVCSVHSSITAHFAKSTDSHGAGQSGEKGLAGSVSVCLNFYWVQLNPFTAAVKHVTRQYSHLYPPKSRPFLPMKIRWVLTIPDLILGAFQHNIISDSSEKFCLLLTWQ